MATKAAAKLNYTTILAEALEAAAAAPAERACGIGRVYVVIVDREHTRGIATAAGKLGRIWQKKAHYGMTNALYVGYDNHDGKTMAQGTAIVATLAKYGIKAYRDEHGD
jgi:hypothetical protein